MNFRLLVLTLVLLFPAAAFAQLSKSEMKHTLRMLQSAPTFVAVVDSLRLYDLHPDSAQLGSMREALWQRYRLDYLRDSVRMRADGVRECRYKGTEVGRYFLARKGVAPANGYPLYIGLHGGGGGPSEMNEDQWRAMQQYYLGSIDSGIYVAPRGPSDTWDLHFTGEAQAFYRQLIREVVAREQVDPNRVYLIGYSAGGDGVYQLAPRLASVLAAANMSAGHHNGVSPQNLAHLPMRLQVGELDGAYDRNKETVRYALLLDSLERLYPGEYVHDVQVHAGAQHSYVRDRQGARDRATVLADPRVWLRTGKSATAQVNGDAPTWVGAYRRDPFPQHLRWDGGTRMDGDDGYYWISMDFKGQQYGKAGDGAEVRYFVGENRVEVMSFSRPLTLHISEAIADPSRPLRVVVDGVEHTVSLHPSLRSQAVSMKLYGEPARATWQEVKVWRDEQGKARVE